MPTEPLIRHEERYPGMSETEFQALRGVLQEWLTYHADKDTRVPTITGLITKLEQLS